MCTDTSIYHLYVCSRILYQISMICKHKHICRVISWHYVQPFIHKYILILHWNIIKFVFSSNFWNGALDTDVHKIVKSFVAVEKERERKTEVNMWLIISHSHRLFLQCFIHTTFKILSVYECLQLQKCLNWNIKLLKYFQTYAPVTKKLRLFFSGIRKVHFDQTFREESKKTTTTNNWQTNEIAKRFSAINFPPKKISHTLLYTLSFPTHLLLWI